MDGTFSVAPALVGQMFCILAEYYEAVHPVAYALLPNKSRQTYTRLFELLYGLCDNLQPQHISVDFELSVMQAVAEVFAGARIDGCLFHLSKNLKKKIGEARLMVRY